MRTKFKEIEAEFSKNSFKVDNAICTNCGIKMEKIIENMSLFDGSLTFHIIKLRCEKCKKEYMDLEQAAKYDLFLLMNKNLGNKPLEKVSKAISNISVS